MTPPLKTTPHCNPARHANCVDIPRNPKSPADQAKKDLENSAFLTTAWAGWNYMEYLVGSAALRSAALRTVIPVSARFMTSAAGMTHMASGVLGRAAAATVAETLLAAGSTAGVQVALAFGAGFTAGVGLEYLPTVWGGERVSHHIANALEKVAGPAPDWAQRLDDFLTNTPTVDANGTVIKHSLATYVRSIF